MISLKIPIPKLFLALAKSSKAPFVRDDIKLLTSQEWAVIEKDVRSENGRRAQGIGVSYTSCVKVKYIGKWFKYAGESADSSTIFFHSNKRWKLTILTAKPTDVAEVCDKMYLKESKSYRERNSEVTVKSRSSIN